MHKLKLMIKTPKWAVPFLDSGRYKGAFGGRGSGKSHAFAIPKEVCRVRSAAVLSTDKPFQILSGISTRNSGNAS